MVRKASGCVIVRNNSILLLHRIDKDWWEVPGGKAEGNETLEEAVLREIKEELVCDVRIVRRLGSTFFKAVKFELDYTWFLGEIKKGQVPKVGVPQEYSQFKYISIDKLRKHKLSSSAQDLITAIEKGEVSL